MQRSVTYFSEFGEHNTPAVIENVQRRLAEGDITTVLVATTGGKTALDFAVALGTRSGLRLVAVGNPPGNPYGVITTDNRRLLVEKGVVVVDYAPYGTASLPAGRNPYGAVDLFAIVADLWRSLGGQGLKVAMEIGLMATAVGVLPPGEKVISVGGTGTGADTAVVMKTAYPPDIFAEDPTKRPELVEFICTPLPKKWW